MTKPLSAPRLAMVLLRLLLPRRARGVVVADLEEEYRNDILSKLSRRQARLWYWREAVSLVRWYLKTRLRKDPRRNVTRTSLTLNGKDGTPTASTRSFLESVFKDIFFGIRSLRRRPLFTTVAAVTLGLGIGATTTRFSVVDGVLLRKLPYEDPGRLVNAWLTNQEWRGHDILGPFWNSIALSYAEYRDWREGNTLFEDIAIYGDEYATLTGTGETEQLHVGLATASLFEVLGVRPSLGRTFLPGEDGPTAERLAILSDEIWRTRFGADREVLGRTVSLDDELYTIVGVLPPRFRLRSIGLADGGDAGMRALWIPIGQSGTRLDRGNRSFEAIGRLMPGISLAAALGETEILLRGDANPSSHGARLVPRKEAEVGGVRSPLLLLLGAASVLLLIACGNVATLLMGEAAGRRLEIATRGALGAGKPRIVRQLLTEGALLGLLGTAAGATTAVLLTKVLVASAPPIIGIEDISVNARALMFAIVAGLFTVLLFGLAPSLRYARDAGGARLVENNRVSARGRHLFQHYVVATEIALTTLLLVAAGLFTRSFASLMAVDPGFHAENLASVRVSLPESRYVSSAEIAAFFREVQERIGTIPDIRIVGGTEEVPLAGGLRVHMFQIENRETPPDERPPGARRTVVLPGFHEVMRIPLLVGRTISESDGTEAEAVMVVSESMARRFWPNETAVGATVLYDVPRTVVGVVGDVQQTALDVDVEPTFYVPHAQYPATEMNIVARTNGDPQHAISFMHDAVRATDPNVPITRSSTVGAFVSQATGDQRYRMLLMLAFAICSAVLATAGVFGVTARAVAMQSRDMGIRLALGAREGILVGATVRSSLATGILGTALGLLGALWASRVLSRFLFGIENTDLATYAAVASLLVLLSLLGSYLPARRITQIDPAETLRVE